MSSLTVHTRPHLSVSSLNTYNTCGVKWKYKYIENIQEKPSASLILWKIADTVFTGYFQKPKPNPLDRFQEILEENLKPLNDCETRDLILEELKEMIPRIKTALAIYFKDYAHLYTPIKAQKEIKVNFIWVRRFIKWFIDLLATKDGQLVIVDHKTSAKSISPTNISLSYQRQLAVYALAIMKEYGLSEIPACELHVIVKTKTPKVQIVPVTIDQNTMFEVINGFRQLERSIKNEHFPLNRWNMLCSKKHCSYWDKCHKEYTDSLSKLLKSVY